MMMASQQIQSAVRSQGTIEDSTHSNILMPGCQTIQTQYKHVCTHATHMYDVFLCEVVNYC